MLGWFKKKFKKEEPEKAPSAADLKIPVAPRDFGQPQEAEKKAPTEEAPLEEKLRELPPEPELEEEIAPEKAGEEVDISETVAEDTEEEEQPEDIEPEESPLPVADLEEESITEEVPAEESEPETQAEAQAETQPEVSEEKPEEVQLPESPAGSLADTKQTEESTEKIPVAARVPTDVPPDKKPAKKQEKKSGLLSRLTEKLTRTRESFTYQLDTLFLGRKEIDADLLDDLEELLITADLGVSTTDEILDYARKKVKRDELSDPAALKKLLKKRIKKFITEYQEDAELVMPDKGPFVIMVVGVNGVGKTTTIGKITHKFLQSNQSVLLVAADTFRAAAVSQLKIWGERNNVSVISQHEGADPSSVVFDAIAHAKAKQYDVVLVDTAGRLHTQTNLMEELKKIKRVMHKQLPGAPHEVMLVVDATTGQNGISQAKLFDAAVDLTGITLTKLDGTAKGGIVANICRELKTPIRFIGVGEQLEDLRDFDPDEFVEALFQGQNDESK